MANEITMKVYEQGQGTVLNGGGSGTVIDRGASFDIPITGLSTGNHTLEVTATDTAAGKSESTRVSTGQFTIDAPAGIALDSGGIVYAYRHYNATGYYLKTPRGWLGSSAYALGDNCVNGANLYECITAGTSASSGGPTGTGTDITDGTAHWRYADSVSNILTTTAPTTLVAIIISSDDEDHDVASMDWVGGTPAGASAWSQVYKTYLLNYGMLYVLKATASQAITNAQLNLNFQTALDETWIAIFPLTGTSGSLGANYGTGNGTSTAQSLTINATAAGSWIIAGFAEWMGVGGNNPTPDANTTIIRTIDNSATLCKRTDPTSGAGNVTVGTTAPTSGMFWIGLAVEVLKA
jgi:hypothetical protein